MAIIYAKKMTGENRTPEQAEFAEKSGMTCGFCLSRHYNEGDADGWDACEAFQQMVKPNMPACRKFLCPGCQNEDCAKICQQHNYRCW